MCLSHRHKQMKACGKSLVDTRLVSFNEASMRGQYARPMSLNKRKLASMFDIQTM